jgi:predicted alpha/beta hydrolase
MSDATDLRIPASDGFALAATRYGPPSPARVVLISPATGVRRRLYDGYARFLADEGFGVLTWDWRGTGDSRPRTLRGFDAAMRGHWAERDLAGVIDWAAAEHPGAKLLAVGHSFGGQGIGLAPNAGRLSALILVAAQSGYWRLWPGASKYRYALLWYALMPALTRALGYFPARRLGIGEDLPKGVALEWARWCRSPAYLGDWRGHAALDVPLLALGFSDDPYAPEPAVRALVERYGSRQKTHRHVRPADVGAQHIGHFGFFRPGVPALWRDTARWLAEASSG